MTTIYKIRHKKTGLFYQHVTAAITEDRSQLSHDCGKCYTSLIETKKTLKNLKLLQAVKVSYIQKKKLKLQTVSFKHEPKQLFLNVESNSFEKVEFKLKEVTP